MPSMPWASLVSMQLKCLRALETYCRCISSHTQSQFINPRNVASRNVEGLDDFPRWSLLASLYGDMKGQPCQ